MLPFFEIESNSFPNAWARAMRLVMSQGMTYPNEWGQRAKGISLVVNFDRTAIKEIEDLKLHPDFPTREIHVKEYLKQFDRENIPKEKAQTKEYLLRMVGEDIPILDKASHFDYTYLLRLTDYNGFDQLESAKEKIKQIGTRRINLITWKPIRDNSQESVPCLQLINLFRINEEQVQGFLTWRSRDGFAAFQTNLCGIVYMINKYILKPCDLILSRLTDYSMNFHVYESNWPFAKKIKLSPSWGKW